MHPDTLDALNASISHWQRMANGTPKKGESIGIDDCALCQLFNVPVPPDKQHLKCRGCPVFEKTGKVFCKDTPFEAAETIAEDTERYPNPLTTKEFRIAAEQELEFLKSLLPK